MDRETDRLTLSWSLFQPTLPEPSVMPRVIEKADEYGVESFDLIGASHIWRGNLDGCLLFEEYPDVRRERDEATVLDTRRRLNRIVEMIHGSGRKATYWHREVMIEKGLLACVTGLLDSNGEVDFSGEAYWELLRNKLSEFFRAVPGMDGIVLTLTEADYSVINNSDKEKYPPVEVAARMIATFAEQLAALGKSLTVRTFGSIDADCATLSAAIDKALGAWEFEVESKITPFDWHLFRDRTPYLKKRPRGTLAAEFDLLGEFFGQGEVPCLYPELIVKEVEFARKAGCHRVSGRIDCARRTCLDSVHEFNVYAFSSAVRNPGITAGEIWASWASRKWGKAASRLVPLMKRSLDMAKKSFYIDGHMMAQYYFASFHHMMLGGTFALFRPGIPLDFARDLWSVLSEKTTPLREAIVREKAEAVEIADWAHETVVALGDAIPAPEYEMIKRAWRHARHTTRMHLATAEIIKGYFDDMEDGAECPGRLNGATERSLDVARAAAQEACEELGRTLAGALPAYEPILQAEAAFVRQVASEEQTGEKESFVEEFARYVVENAEIFRSFYAAERAARNQWEDDGAVVDCVICGGLADEWRITRVMHGSGVEIRDGRPVRMAGNRVFPSGSLEYQMMTCRDGASELLVVLHGAGGPARVTVDGVTTVAEPPKLEAFGAVSICVGSPKEGRLNVRLEKAGPSPPLIGALVVRKVDA